uniref:Tantalus-like domain-containing protein n=1 Tax=Eptatretus burgeri TaxID=7764 RepID=A0A8C4QXN4_EPTBU
MLSLQPSWQRNSFLHMSLIFLKIIDALVHLQDHTLCRAVVLPKQSPWLLDMILDESPLRYRIPASWHSFQQLQKDDSDVAAVNGTEFKEGGCSTDGDESRDGAKVVTGDIPANEYENVSVCPFVEKTQRFTDNNEPGAWCEDCDGLHMAKEVGHSREMNETLVETEIATKAADVAVSGTESETVALLVNVTTDKTLVNKTMDSTGAEDEMNVRNVQQEAALSQPCKLRLRIRPAPANSHLCLTPLGLPKAKRLKKNFTLEDVYLNRNYKTPPQNRKYETIFENPQEQKGRLVLTSRAKKCRSLIFGTKRGHRKSRISRSSWTNICRSSTEEPTLDSLLLHKLAELEMPVAPDE